MILPKNIKYFKKVDDSKRLIDLETEPMDSLLICFIQKVGHF